MRHAIINDCKRIVVKVGSHVVAAQKTGLNTQALRRVAKSVLEAKASGYEVVVVSSGAIISGIQKLGLAPRLTHLPLKQAAAAVGQGYLIRAYDHVFEAAGHTIAQILLTNDDMMDRQRFLNTRHTINTLLKLGVTPIVNENDTVSVAEIKFGDNDMLACMVANLIDAQLLIILSDVDGLFSEDPRRNPKALLIPTVHKVTRDIEDLATSSTSVEGTGGMASKVAAAKRMSASGVPTIIVNGTRAGAMSGVLAGKEVGTVFLPQNVRRASRKHWIAFIRRTKGRLTLDDGAAKAVLEQGRSLLPAGVIAVYGAFDHSDAVTCVDRNGHEIARGLVNYSSRALDRVKGLKTGDIRQVLGYKDYDEVIHRDNMVLM